MTMFRTISAPMSQTVQTILSCLLIRSMLITMKICSVDGCEHRMKGHDLCELHLRRWRRESKPRKRRLGQSTTGPCIIDGCDKPIDSRGMCSTHLHIQKKKESIRYSMRHLWDTMMSRCYNPQTNGYEYYGGKGITVDLTWHDFDNFMSDMGPRPDGYQLGRIHHDKPYGPGNVIWVTPTENIRDRSNSIKVMFSCTTLPLIEACKIVDMPYPQIARLMRNDKTFYQAISTYRPVS
jgi:hypothetical protein